jgi:hypothetical protein
MYHWCPSPTSPAGSLERKGSSADLGEGGVLFSLVMNDDKGKETGVRPTCE